MAASSVKTATEAARRYAGAIFELAKDKKALKDVAADLKTLTALADDSEDMRRLMQSPAFSSEDKTKALVAIAEKAGLSKLTTGFVGTMAQNGRSSDLIGAAIIPQLVVHTS